MSSIPWKEYLAEMITTFRSEFQKFSPEAQELIRESVGDRLPLEPCQIEVLDFGKLVIWLMIHNNLLPDLMFKIHTNVKNLDASEFINDLKYEFFMSPKEASGEFLLRESIYIHTVRFSFAIADRPSPQQLATMFLLTAKGALRTEQVDAIRRGTDGLKKSIAKIPEKNIRDELLVTTRKIDTALQELKRFDEEIGKVRQLVGVSQEYQDWRLLVTDVGKLKEEHVPREVFDAKIGELNTRIDAFKEIKEGYEKVLDQQAEIMEKQSSFLTWIKYSTILVPIAVACIAVIELLLRSYLHIP